MVDHFIDLAYLHLMKIEIQDDKLAVNQPLKYGLPNLDLESIDIMQTMEYFMNSLSYQQLSMPIRQYHFVGFDLIIKMPFVKEKSNYNTMR